MNRREPLHWTLELCPSSSAASFDEWSKPAAPLSRHVYHGEPYEDGNHVPRLGKDERAWLRAAPKPNPKLDEVELRYDDTKRRGRGEKTHVSDRMENRTGVSEWGGSTPRQRYEEALEKHSEAGYRFLKRFVEGMAGRRPFWKPEKIRRKRDRRFDRFTVAALTEEGQKRRQLEIDLDRLSGRAAQLHERENRVLAGSDETGWARVHGVKRASRLERVKQSHVEDALIAALDLWRASGATRIERGQSPLTAWGANAVTERGYHPPRELVALFATELGGWSMADVEAVDPMLPSETRWFKHKLQDVLRDYAPRDWDWWRHCRTGTKKLRGPSRNAAG
jgi:hypothetical protein